MKPHPHAEVIKAWADGAEVQFRQPEVPEHYWTDIVEPEWNVEVEYRVKPAEPVYPVTTLTNDDLYVFAENTSSRVEACRLAANAALRHACDNGEIVTREEFDRAVSDRKSRDEEIAKAALKEINEWIERVNHSHNNIPFSFDVNNGHIKAIIHAADKE